MLETKEQTWALIARPEPPEVGQRFFERLATGDLYVADNSGSDPDVTDCGPLRMLPSRAMDLTVDSRNRIRITAPVFVERDGTMGSVGLTYKEAHYLIHESKRGFKLALNHYGEQLKLLSLMLVGEHIHYKQVDPPEVRKASRR